MRLPSFGILDGVQWVILLHFLSSGTEKLDVASMFIFYSLSFGLARFQTTYLISLEISTGASEWEGWDQHHFPFPGPSSSHAVLASEAAW